MCLSVSPCASLNMHMPSTECGGQRTTPGISTHLLSCLRQDLLFAVAYCQTSWSLSVWGSPACTRILLYNYRYYRHALLRPAEHGFWGVNSGPHDRVVSVLLTEPSLQLRFSVQVKIISSRLCLGIHGHTTVITSFLFCTGDVRASVEE